MNISVTTPAILFPAITLLMLAYTNRFLALSQLIRQLHKDYHTNQLPTILKQINHLRHRILLIRVMQACGALSILLCAISIFSILFNLNQIGLILFLISLVFFCFSVMSSLYEILLSSNALAVLLSDIDETI